MRIARSRLFWAAALLVLAGLVFWWWYEPTYTIRISRETTYLTEPLRPDGTVDYAAAVDARIAAGVTRENNAAILLLQALGPSALDPKTCQETLDRLGMVLPLKGGYLVSWSDFETTTPMPPSSGPAAAVDGEAPDEACKRLWTVGECPRLAKYLALNKAPLDMVARATQRDRFHLPLVTAGERHRLTAWIIPPLQRYIALSRTLAARANGRFAQGDFDGAWSDLLTCHRLARLVPQLRSLIANFVGYTIDGVACRSEKAWLASGRLTAAQARRMVADLQALPPLPAVGPVISEGERLFALDVISQLATEGLGQLNSIGSVGSGGPQPPASPEKHIDWNKAMVRINAHYDKMDQACRQPTHALRVQAFDALERELDGIKLNVGTSAGWLDYVYSKVPQLAEGQLRRELKKNPGEYLLVMLASSLGRSRAMEDVYKMGLGLNIVALGLVAYKAENGNFPASLSVLAPAYLKVVPQDRFTDKPLIYKPSANGFTLYSVGPNMKDDGGVEKGGGGKDDIVVQVGPAAKAGK